MHEKFSVKKPEEFSSKDLEIFVLKHSQKIFQQQQLPFYVSLFKGSSLSRTIRKKFIWPGIEHNLYLTGLKQGSVFLVLVLRLAWLTLDRKDLGSGPATTVILGTLSWRP